MKKVLILKYLASIFDKKNKNSLQYSCDFFVFTNKNQHHCEKQILAKLAKFYSKIPEKVTKISPEFTLFSQNLNLDNSLQKQKLKIFLILYSKLDKLSNDTSLNTYDEYIDRPKLTEQKKLV